MALFDQIGKMITNAGQETAAKARNIADIAKLNSNIDSLRQEINRLSLELGKAYYERHKNDVVFAEDPERMTAIRNAYAEIAQYQVQIDQIKGVETCQNCGAEISAGSMFCSACGAKVAKPEPVPQEGKFCPQCHASVGEEDLFCMSCGANLLTITNDGEV